MQFVGERFPINVPEDKESSPTQPPPTSASASASASSPAPFPGLDFVKDVQERPITAPRPPAAPIAKSTSTGFPEHKKRTGLSRFRQARQDKNNDTTSAASTLPQGTPSRSTVNRTPNNQDDVKKSIDKENKDKLASMSESEIAQERRDLLQGLPASLVERLLRRANIDQDEHSQDWFAPEKDNSSSTDTHLAEEAAPLPGTEQPGTQPQKPKKSVTFASEPPENNLSPSKIETPAAEDNKHDTTAHDHNEEDDTPFPNLPHPIHFPSAPSLPPLDPTSTTFLTDLHDKYFPSLPSNPSSLTWLDPTSTTSNSYNPASSTGIPINRLRFSFTGQLLPPNKSLNIPTSFGLHHHGDEPEAAGYTIGELAHLGRSTVPGQRSVAFLTLGRVLFRLGKGEFGSRGRRGQDQAHEQRAGGTERQDGEEEEEEEGDDDGLVKGMDELEKGLWACIKEGRVLETLQQEVNKTGGHVSAKAYAAEALWLWQQGGGKQIRAE